MHVQLCRRHVWSCSIAFSQALPFYKALKMLTDDYLAKENSVNAMEANTWEVTEQRASFDCCTVCYLATLS